MGDSFLPALCGSKRDLRGLKGEELRKMNAGVIVALNGSKCAQNAVGTTSFDELRAFVLMAIERGRRRQWEG